MSTVERIAKLAAAVDLKALALKRQADDVAEQAQGARRKKRSRTAPPVSFVEAFREPWRQIHVGCAYLADSQINSRALSALHLIVPAAKRQASEDLVPAAVESILRDLGLEESLDVDNEQVQLLCEKMRQPADLHGLSHLPGEALVTAVVAGLGLSTSIRDELRNPPDIWVQYQVFHNNRAIGDLPVAYMS